MVHRQRLLNPREMQMKRPDLLAVLVAIAACCISVTLVSGCRQTEDERCQVQDDCEPELVCCVRDNTEAKIIGGVCKPANRCELDLTDAGVDAGSTDGSASDQGTGSDALPSDSAAADSASDVAVDVSVQDATSDVSPADMSPDAVDSDSGQ